MHNPSQNKTDNAYADVIFSIARKQDGKHKTSLIEHVALTTSLPLEVVEDGVHMCRLLRLFQRVTPFTTLNVITNFLIDISENGNEDARNFLATELATLSGRDEDDFLATVGALRTMDQQAAQPLNVYQLFGYDSEGGNTLGLGVAEYVDHFERDEALKQPENAPVSNFFTEAVKSWECATHG